MDVVVIGGGPSGIASALTLKDAGIHAVVLDREHEVASAWRGRYDRLRLNSCRPLSHLPRRRYPKGTPMFPTRDQVIEHIAGHARELDFRGGTNVERIDREDGGWLLTTSAGETRSPQVIVATGFENRPFIPDWPGRSEFGGELIHSGEYWNPSPFAGKRVLVVGPGCSGMEIAYDLAEGGAAKVWLSVRTPPNIILREGPGKLPGDVLGTALFHMPVRFADAVARFGRRTDIGDLTEYGLPVPEEGLFTRLRRLGVAPAIVDREVIDAIKDGRIEIVRGVESLDAGGVGLAGGGRVEPDAVIAATGYTRALEPLVGHLDVLDSRGLPRALGEEPAAPGLRFIGYVSRPGAIGYMGKEARRAAKAIARELRGTGGAPRETAAAVS